MSNPLYDNIGKREKSVSKESSKKLSEKIKKWLEKKSTYFIICLGFSVLLLLVTVIFIARSCHIQFFAYNDGKVEVQKSDRENSYVLLLGFGKRYLTLEDDNVFFDNEEDVIYSTSQNMEQDNITIGKISNYQIRLHFFKLICIKMSDDLDKVTFTIREYDENQQNDYEMAEKYNTYMNKKYKIRSKDKLYASAGIVDSSEYYQFSNNVWLIPCGYENIDGKLWLQFNIELSDGTVELVWIKDRSFH